VGGRSETPPRYGTVDDLMQKWHADYVAQNKKEPTTDEIAAQRAELAKESKPRGQRVAQLQMRLSIAANEVAKATEAITQLPAGTTLGIFGGAQAKMGEGLVENIKKNLANQVTPQSSQLLASMTNGVTRGLAILEAGGAAQGLVGLSTQLQRDLPQASDTGLTIASKYADIRQITEAATEVLMADPDVDKKQIELLQKITDQVRRAIPFTNVDVARLYNADDETIAGFAKRIGLGEASGQAAPAAGGGADHPDQVQGGVLYKWQNGQYQPVQRVQ
jgi:hypothetical protein